MTPTDQSQSSPIPMTVQVSTFTLIIPFLNSHLDKASGSFMPRPLCPRRKSSLYYGHVTVWLHAVRYYSNKSVQSAVSPLPLFCQTSHFSFTSSHVFVCNKSYFRPAKMVLSGVLCACDVTQRLVGIDRSATGVGASWRHSNIDCSEKQTGTARKLLRLLQVCSKTEICRVRSCFVLLCWPLLP